MIRDTCEIDDGNNECDPRTYFIPTSEEIQADMRRVAHESIRNLQRQDAEQN